MAPSGQAESSLQQSAKLVQSNPGGRPGWGGSNHGAIKVLQFLVGGLVTFGGASFAFLAVNSFGTALGLIHLTIGLVGLFAAFLTLMSDASWLGGFLIAINAVTIAYSSLSESVAEVESLLPGFTATGSLVGTVVAIVMSFTIIYLLLASHMRSSEPASLKQGGGSLRRTGLLAAPKQVSRLTDALGSLWRAREASSLLSRCVGLLPARFNRQAFRRPFRPGTPP